MKILHVSIGLPPLRTGGLTRYCTELMEAQAVAGDEVCLLYPGHFLPGAMRIERRKWKRITTYELVNPLPVALTYGVVNPADYMLPCDKYVYQDFLGAVRPDIVHVHSTMGIHREFFEIAKEMGIPLVYTTHDYYLMCPRCTFVDNRGLPCARGASAATCARCNMASGMTLNKSRVMQSHMYARLKNSKVAHMVGTVVKRRMNYDGHKKVKLGTTEVSHINLKTQEAYSSLLSYNISIAKLFDIYICNSTNTQARFQSFMPKSKMLYFPITHSGLTPSGMSCKTFSIEKPIKIGYFGGYKVYKGFNVLIDAISLLKSAHVNYELHLYGGNYPAIYKSSNCIIEGIVKPSQMQAVISNLDLIIVPSICPETFGFVVLEAICTGVPVVCSDIVGASDLVTPECTFEKGNSEELFECIMHLYKPEGISIGLPDDYPISMDEQVQGLAHIYSMFATGSLRSGISNR